jgi:N-acetylglucosamine kinase-like BadF-type ATPase
MIIIADSGSTKTDWVLAAPGGDIIQQIKTEGINPVHQNEDDILHTLTCMSSMVQPTASEAAIEAILFYGSGLRPEYQPLLTRLLARHFQLSTGAAQAEGDLLGAARALCGHGEGIACILGTGANSCLYDGRHIVQNTPPMGYILGDEGSGAVLGRNLLNALYKGLLPTALREDFEKEMHTDLADVIAHVYRQPLPNRYLASLTPFIARHLSDCPALSQMLIESFQLFIRRNIAPYQHPHLPLSATGSIAHYYHAELSQAASLEGYRLGHVVKAPIEGLIAFHTGQ